MSHDEAVMFYQDIVNKIVSEVNQEKQKGNFDEETYYNNKVNEVSIDNMSVLRVSKSMKIISDFSHFLIFLVLLNYLFLL